MTDFKDSRLSILNAAMKCNIKIIKRASSEEFAARCPFCGDSENPHHGHLMLNVVKDAYHCTRCGERGFAIGLYARVHRIDNKQSYRELMELKDETPAIEIKQVPQNPIANLEQRDRVYRAFLRKLNLEKTHLQDLIKRGLSWQEIGQNLYKSVPQDEKTRESICNELIKEGYDLKGIPGFYKDNNWTFVDYKGFLIPVKDVQGHIQGLQIRLDDVSEHKYRWFSSKDKPYGTSAHAWIGVSGVPSKKVIITEGPLKADIAHYLSRFTFVSVAGVDAIKGIEQVLKELEAERVYIAFDADKRTNMAVQKAENRLKEVLLKNSFDVRVKEWDGRLGKGIDDYLLTLRKQKVKKAM